MTLTLDVAKLARTKILSGAANGQILAEKLLKSLPLEGSIRLVVLDFSGVKIATASFLREAVLGFRDLARRRGYGVAVGAASPEIIEDLTEVLLARAEVITRVETSPGTDQPKVSFLGPLDQGLRHVLDAVAAEGEVDAIGLAEKHPQDGIGATGWNNRLTALVQRGLLLESRYGRRKRYRSFLGGKPYGS